MQQSPANALLLACCRAHPDPDHLASAVRRTTDWSAFCSQAIGLGLGPLAFDRLRDSALRPGPPPEALNRLGADYLAQAARNARGHAHMEAVLDRLQAAGIAVTVLKGAALAEPAYGNVALRSMIDVDLLVRPEALSEATALLRAAGFTPYERWRSAAWYEETGHHHAAPLVAPDQSLMIELHRHIVSRDAPVAFDVDGLWDRTVPIRVGTTDTRSLSPTDMLLHLAVHLTLSRHYVGHLRTLCDVAVICDHYRSSVQWDHLTERAREGGASRYAWYPLAWARELLAVDVPTEALDRLRRDGRAYGPAHGLLHRQGRRLVLRPAGGPGRLPYWLWDDLCAAWFARPGGWGVAPVVGAFYRGLLASARQQAPTLPPWLLPIYALTLRPIGAAWHAVMQSGGGRASRPRPPTGDA